MTEITSKLATDLLPVAHAENADSAFTPAQDAAAKLAELRGG